jgi:hypothetical protein
MNKKTKTSTAVEATAPSTDNSVDAAVTEMAIKEINEVLAKHKRSLQPILTGYPYYMKPEVRVVPLPEQAQANVVKEENA